MLGLTLCDVSLPLADDIKVQIANTASKYVLDHWDEVVTIEIIKDTVISVTMDL